MDTNEPVASTSASWAGYLGAASFFILWGCFLISQKIPLEWDVPVWVYNIFLNGIIFLPPIGMCIGWIKSFPRWSYPYVGHVLLFSPYLSGGATPANTLFGYSIFENELWGWRAVILFVLTPIVALAITRSWRPIATLFTNIWNDWTLLTFGMFGLMPMVVVAGFDEVDRLFSLYFVVFLAFVMTVTALLYIRVKQHDQRIIALFSGSLVTIVTTIIAPGVYWHGQGDEFSWQFLEVVFTLVLYMFLPASIGLAHHLNPGPEEV